MLLVRAARLPQRLILIVRLVFLERPALACPVPEFATVVTLPLPTLLLAVPCLAAIASSWVLDCLPLSEELLSRLRLNASLSASSEICSMRVSGSMGVEGWRMRAVERE